MRNYPLLIIFIGLSILCIQNTDAQKHDLDFKVRELTHGTGANIQNVKVDIDNGSYTGFTDANGVAHIHSVTDGTHRIQVSKPGYIEFLQDGYVLDGNKVFNASMINKNRHIPAGDDVFNVSWWRQTYADVGTFMWNQDVPRWANTAPINNVIAPGYTYTDSLNIVAAINEIEAKVGYNLITLVPNNSSPPIYTINTHSNNYSTIEIDGTYTIISGYSNISVTSPTKRVIHEIVQQFGMYPIYTTAYTSVMEPNVSTVADMQVWDADNIAVTFDQHYAKSRGEQDLFLGNMMEYVTPVTPAATTNRLPANNATGLDNVVRVMWDNVAGTDKYHLDIATDAAFSNMIQDLMVYRSDTTITLNVNQQYFMRVQDINTAGTSAWSSITTFTTSTITAIDDNFLEQPFKVYPTICSSRLTVELIPQKPSEYAIEILSLTGDQVLKQFGKTSLPLTLPLDISGFRPGPYFVKLSFQYSDSKIIKTFKIIKQ